MSKFSHLLKNHNFFFLWLGQIISQIGDRLGQMALIGLVYLRFSGSTIQLAKILSFTIIPVFLIGPLAGAYVDRWDRRRTMYICDFLRAVLVFIIPFFFLSGQGILLIYFTIFLVFCLGRFFIPAKLSIIPELVEEKDLVMANSLVNTAGMIATFLGFGISGIIVEHLGVKSGFYLDALSFLLSAILIFLIAQKKPSFKGLSKVGKEIVEVIRKSVLTEIKEGLFYFIEQKDLRFSAIIFFILASSLGTFFVVSITFIQQVLNSATKDLGILIMFLGIGLFLGSIIYGRFGQRISLHKIIAFSLILTGISLAAGVFLIYRFLDFRLAIATSILLGILVSPTVIAVNTIVHRVSDNEMMGKVFSSLEIVMHLGFLLFMFISGWLARIFSSLAILIFVGILLFILGIISFIYHRKLPWLD